MILYFDKNGVLKEIINDKAIRAGNSGINSIYAYVEDNMDGEGLIRYQLADGSSTTAETIMTKVEDMQIPYDQKRDLKYFKYYKNYTFYKANIPDDVLDLVTEQNNTIRAIVRVYINETYLQLGDILFTVDYYTKKVNPEEYLTIAQYNYLLSVLLDKVSLTGDNVLTGSLSINSNSLLFTDLNLSMNDIYNDMAKLSSRNTFTAFNDFEGNVEFDEFVGFYGDRIYIETATLDVEVGAKILVDSDNLEFRDKNNATFKFIQDTNESRLNDLEKRVYRLERNVFTLSTDSTTAYTKTVPSNSLEYAILDSVGGMSYKSDNLLDISDVVETTINDVTYSVSNGVITLNGTATSSFNLLLFEIDNLTIGTTYTYNGFVTNSNPFNNLSLTRDGNTTYVTTLTYQSGDVVRLQAYIGSGSTFNNAIAKPMLVSGSDAPTTYQPYFEGIRDSAVTSIVGAETKAIPSEVQSLEGYGWGINDSCYNYIDFERKVFVKKVARADLGSFTWNKNTSSIYTRFFIILNDIKIISSSGNLMNGLCAKYDIVTANASYGEGTTGISQQGGTPQAIFVRDSTFDNYTATEVQTALNGVYLYYELATPVETDISEYIDDGYINVEGGGSLTFTNEYEQDVPSVVTYLEEA